MDKIYSSFTDNITGKIVDSTVDGAIDKVKSNIKQSTTYVWTAINKETHGGNMVNIIFINKLGQRRRVAYENLNDFCTNNYVSNLMIRDGKIEMAGCSLRDLPDFRLNKNGQYDLHATHDENWVYNQAYAYIQSQERLIQEDIKNKCLRGDNKEPTESNITGNLSAIKDITQATAVTAMTAATVAGVAGVAVVGKAIYNKLNSKKVVEQQESICKVLHKYTDLLHCMLLMKYKTNQMYKDNVDMTTYNNNIDARNELSGKLANNIKTIGVQGCLKQAYDGVAKCRSQASAYKIGDVPMKISGVNFGTINAYIDNVENSINNIKQLHLETKTLMERNIQLKREEEYNRNLQIQRQQEQDNLVNDINTEVLNLQSIIESYDNIDINGDSAEYLVDSFERYDIVTKLSNLDIKIDNIDNINIRNNYKNTLYTLNIKTNTIKDNVIVYKQRVARENREEINNSLSESERVLETLILGTYTGTDYLNAMNTINNSISNSKMKLNTISDMDRDIISNRIEALENKLNKSRRCIESNMQSMENQQASLSRLDLVISKYEGEIELESKASNILRKINSFSNSANNSIYNIKNETLVNIAKQKINEAKDRFTEIYNNKLNEEADNERVNEEKLAEISNEVDTQLQYVRESSLGVITDEALNSFTVDYSLLYNKLANLNTDYNKKNTVKNKISTLEREYNSKKREYKNILDKEKKAIIDIGNTIDNIKLDIEKLDKYTVTRVNTKINNIKTSSNYRNIQVKDVVDSKIEEVLQLFNEKRVELGL